MNTVIAKHFVRIKISYSGNRAAIRYKCSYYGGGVTHAFGKAGRFGKAPAGTDNEIDRIIPNILTSPFAGHERLLLDK